MAIVGRTKCTRACEISRRRDAKGAPRIFGAPFASRLLELSRARVYFARPAIAIAKIRDYSQSRTTEKGREHNETRTKIKRPGDMLDQFKQSAKDRLAWQTITLQQNWRRSGAPHCNPITVIGLYLLTTENTHYLDVELLFRCPLRNSRNFCLGANKAVQSARSCHAWT